MSTGFHSNQEPVRASDRGIPNHPSTPARQVVLRRAFVALAIAAACSVLPMTAADARMGGGGSFGSRGSRSFSMPSATPTAPRVSPFQSSATPRPGFGGSGFARPGFFGGGFGRGLIGGFLGAGLFGMLFGGGFGGGLGGGMSFIGLLLQLGLLFLVVRFLMNMFRNRQAAGYGGTMSAFGGGAPAGGSAGRPQTTPITIGPDDYQAFERRLTDSQYAYGEGDVGALRRLATAEMAGNFEQELAGNARQGVVNKLSNVKLLQGRPLGSLARKRERLRDGCDEVLARRRDGRDLVRQARQRQRHAAAGRDGGMDLYAPRRRRARPLAAVSHPAGLMMSPSTLHIRRRWFRAARVFTAFPTRG